MNIQNPKTILITGCSSGFGLLSAARLASKGHNVIATMRDLDKQGELFSEVNHRGGKVNLLQLDVTDKESIEQAAFEVASEYGYIDILINNAGFAIIGSFEDLTENEIRLQMETNFFGVQNVTREFIPLMRQRKRAKIINISSTSGFTTHPLFGAYCASKWALEAFSESLRWELSLFDIDVLLVEPGAYKTKLFFQKTRRGINFSDQRSPYSHLSNFLDKKTYDRLKNNHKNPEEVAELIEHLIISKNPPFRSIPDIESKMLYFLRKILPFRIYSWIYKTKVFNGFSQKPS